MAHVARRPLCRVKTPRRVVDDGEFVANPPTPWEMVSTRQHRQKKRPASKERTVEGIHNGVLWLQLFLVVVGFFFFYILKTPTPFK